MYLVYNGIWRKIMTITKRSKYGLKALVYMACNPEKKFSVKEIAEREVIPKRYLEQIFSALKKEEIIVSIKGAQGGYLLARPAKEISVADVLRPLEDTQESSGCCGCKPEDIEYTLEKEVWENIDTTIRKITEGISLDDLKNKHYENSADIYYI